MLRTYKDRPSPEKGIDFNRLVLAGCLGYFWKVLSLPSMSREDMQSVWAHHVSSDSANIGKPGNKLSMGDNGGNSEYGLVLARATPTGARAEDVSGSSCLRLSNCRGVSYPRHIKEGCER